jgi:hypothetical protein
MRAVYHYFNPQASPRLRLMEDVVTTICQDLKRDKKQKNKPIFFTGTNITIKIIGLYLKNQALKRI